MGVVVLVVTVIMPLASAAGDRAAPLVLAHRAGSGQWPQNSRTAVLSSIAAATREQPPGAYQGIEVDVVLTRNGVPVLSHDPWIDPAACTLADGRPLTERRLIRELTWTEARSTFLCGGLADPEFPDVTPRAETLMTLDEVLQALRAAPAMALYLDLKIDGDLTREAADYAQAVFERWDREKLPNRLFVEGPSQSALEEYRHAAGTPFTAVLSFPVFSASENPTWTGAKAWFRVLFGFASPQTAGRAAHADAVAAPRQILTERTALDVRRAGLEVAVFPANTRAELSTLCDWPIDVILTDYPELGNCASRSAP